MMTLDEGKYRDALNFLINNIYATPATTKDDRGIEENTMLYNEYNEYNENTI